MNKTDRKGSRGMTLIETTVSIAIFLLVGTVIYQFFSALLVASQNSRRMVTAVELMSEQVEIVRNLAFDDVGIEGGLPNGVLSHSRVVDRDGQSFEITTTVRNVDDPFDGTLSGDPNDLSPADYRLVEIGVACLSCKNNIELSYTTTQAPKSLETSSGNGALFVRTLDADGLPVQGAGITILNESEFPEILIEDTTDNDGYLRIIDAPPGEYAYQVSAEKPGYSGDQTYLPGAPENPNPSKSHATVIQQRVTSLTLFIDLYSTLEVTSMTELCAPIGNVPFRLHGSDTIGNDPEVLRYDENLSTNGLGQLTLSNMRWDSYDSIVEDGAYSLQGRIPVTPLSLPPNTNQSLKLVVGAADPLALLVTVTDISTQLPIADAEVTLTLDEISQSRQTGRGYRGQTDWSGGSGQELIGDETGYLIQDGNISTDSPAGELKLEKVFGLYESAGNLTSSTFDTGAVSNFHQLLWLPSDQPIETGVSPVRFQIATSDDPEEDEWNFIGPDGTGGSYYTAAENELSAAHDGDRYLRYRIFLSTDDQNFTPNVSDVNFTFTSDCTPPGQAYFSGLENGTYRLEIDADGYDLFENDEISISNDWSEIEINLSTS